ncbi:uncharacterized protein OCT59_003695 [Rhizophagus irregularis]|nr:hypothetical protein OCT59_003695 [Rhizophagus irregularis]
MDYILLQKLSQNLLEILDDDEYYDITIEVGNDPYVKIFRSHIVILNYRSSYLRRILSTNKKKNDGTLVHIKLPNISPEIFQLILWYIYGGKLSLIDYDNLDIIKILVAANELNLQELITHIQSFLIQNKTKWMEQNFNLIYQTSFENNSFLELQKYCTDLMSKYPDKILKSLDFSSVPEKILISLIQSDNLQMNEIQVWENVLKWGLAQNPGLPSNPSNYSKVEFNSLKNTLQSCIPFIRFYNLTSQEFSDHILPYKEVLPEELYMDLLKTFLSLNPNSTPGHKSNPRMTKEITPPPPLRKRTAPPPSRKKSINSIDSLETTFNNLDIQSRKEIIPPPPLRKRTAPPPSRKKSINSIDSLETTFNNLDIQSRKEIIPPPPLRKRTAPPPFRNKSINSINSLETTFNNLDYSEDYQGIQNVQRSLPAELGQVISVQYQEILSIFEKMGFNNKEENLKALKEFDGDMEKVLSFLLKE